MIKVTVRSREVKENKFVEETKIDEHEEGAKAWVHNGVLTIFPANANNTDFGQAIAGYEAGAWLDWKIVKSDSQKK